MTIKQTGGIFGRNPSFNEIDAVDGNFSGNLTVDTSTLFVDASNNRVGVGTTSPAEPLHVIGTVRSTTSSTGDNNFYATSTGGGAYRIYPDSAATANPTWLHQTNSSEDIAWVIGGVERMRLNSSGSLSFPSGQGIDFSATSGTGTSELFDDYEEGSFSPNVDGSVTGTATYTRQVGKYIKVGAQVTAIIDVRWSAHTGAGTMYIKDLPFVGVYNAANITQSAAVGFYGFSIGALYIPSLTLGNSSSTLFVGRQPVGGGASAPNSLPSSGAVVATITYMAA